MDFRLTEEDQAFQKEVREWIQEIIHDAAPPGFAGVDPGPEEEAREEIEKLAAKVWKGLGAKGWISLSWPKEYGGREDEIKAWILSEELIYNGLPGMDIAGCQADLILQFGTEDQKKRFLPPISKGEVKYAIGMSEPDVGSDMFALQLKAEEKDDHFLFNGQKIWNSGIQRVDWCVVYARTDPNAEKQHNGISVFIIDPKSPGVTLRQITQITGLAAFCEVFYADVRVPKENLLGQKNRGKDVSMFAFTIERSYGMVILHNARRYFEQLVEYCKETEINGQPLSKDPLIRNRLADMAIELEVGKNLGDRINWMNSQGMMTVIPGCQNKIYGSRAAQKLSNLGMDILGLYGQLDETSKWAQLEGRFRHMYLSSRAWSLAGGTSEMSRNIISGPFGLGLPS